MEEVKRETFETLLELQEVLSKKFDLEREIKELPKELNTRTEELQRMKKTYVGGFKLLEETRQEIASLQHRLAEATAAREQAEAKMDMVSTQREYEAINKEIAHATELEVDIRAELQRLDRRATEADERLSEESELIETEEAAIAALQEELEAAITERTDELEALGAKKDTLTPSLSKAILYKFERIIHSKDGVGIVGIVDTQCMGCHMLLPAEFVNRVRIGNQFIFCPYCSRVLNPYAGDTAPEAVEEAKAAEEHPPVLAEQGLADLISEEDLDW